MVEHFTEPSLCDQMIQVCKCVVYELAGIQLGTLDKQIRNNQILPLDTNHSLLQSTHELLLHKIDILQQMLYQYYGVAFSYKEHCSVLKYEPGQFYRRHIDNSSHR
ncbi:hypothetical protein RintRC_1315 [Richelia intracellularis]|nr:hypothetical protein RintRC_1315 [Richelia intracellularis]